MSYTSTHVVRAAVDARQAEAEKSLRASRAAAALRWQRKAQRLSQKAERASRRADRAARRARLALARAL